MKGDRSRSPTMLKKHQEPSPLGQGLAEIFDRRSWRVQWGLVGLARDWSSIVGETVSARSMPAFFRRDVLWIYVSSPIWMQQLQLQKQDLLDRIRRYLSQDEVADLRWLLFPPELLPENEHREPEAIPERKLTPGEEESFRTMVSGIADPESQEALFRLWLASRKKGLSGRNDG